MNQFLNAPDLYTEKRDIKPLRELIFPHKWSQAKSRKLLKNYKHELDS